MALVVLLATNVMASSSVKMNLAELVSRSRRIFAGKCVAAESDYVVAPGGVRLAVTKYTFEIRRALKGSLGQTLQIRQLRSAAVESGLGISKSIVAGLPVYEIGREYVLLLTADSKIGLTAPVGLQQGSFSVVTKGGHRQKIVANGLNNAGLFALINQSGALSKMVSGLPEGPLAFDTFVDLLGKLVQ